MKGILVSVKTLQDIFLEKTERDVDIRGVLFFMGFGI
jgi:hypothetical protein